jgi:hypothetical protein
VSFSKLPRCVCCVLLYCFIITPLSYLVSVDAQDTRHAVWLVAVWMSVTMNESTVSELTMIKVFSMPAG